MRLLPSYLS
ncbi:hypothetical protein E2C01_064235 [Portunus trituberculatus]|uniref:Uncharacterized protein n=1 Tax=Portunus trituberculatus TaxID=210409 RepID=A0A5B7HB62_PORTR|nr:hypothetical protein [Portunus trituberculatus]